jgi:hypothetical protein
LWKVALSSCRKCGVEERRGGAMWQYLAELWVIAKKDGDGSRYWWRWLGRTPVRGCGGHTRR